MSNDKDAFIKALAVFFTKDQMRRSIEVELKLPYAIAWATVRSYTPLTGWPTIDEAEKQLREFLSDKEPSAALKNPVRPPGAQILNLDLLHACKRIVYEDQAGEISIGAIEDCKRAIEKAEEQWLEE